MSFTSTKITDFFSGTQESSKKTNSKNKNFEQSDKFQQSFNKKSPNFSNKDMKNYLVKNIPEKKEEIPEEKIKYVTVPDEYNKIRFGNDFKVKKTIPIPDIKIEKHENISLDSQKKTNNIFLDIQKKSDNISLDSHKKTNNIFLDIQKKSDNVSLDSQKKHENISLDSQKKHENISLDSQKKHENISLDSQKKTDLSLDIQKKSDLFLDSSINLSLDLFQKKSEFKVYTDGSCINNGKKDAKAGMGVYFGENDFRNVSKPVSGKQTNNTAELGAILEAVEILKKEIESGQRIIIYTDSEYAIKCFTTYGRKIHHMDNPENIPNLELIKKGFAIFSKYHSNLILRHIRSHTGKKDEDSLGNEQADLLANKAIGITNKPEKIYLKVAFADKDTVKDMGAKWDKHRKSWYTNEHHKEKFKKYL